MRAGGPDGREHYLPGLCLLLGAGAHPAHDSRKQRRDKQPQGTVALVFIRKLFSKGSDLIWDKKISNLLSKNQCIRVFAFTFQTKIFEL